MTARPILPPAYFLATLIAMAILHLALPITRWLSLPWNLIGLLPLMVGGWLNAACSRAFDRHDTTIKPFEEPNALLDAGPFKYSRNPMYLGLILILVGVALLFGTLSPLVLIPAFAWLLTKRFIAAEEAALTQRFGARYLEYKRRVRRWL